MVPAQTIVSSNAQGTDIYLYQKQPMTAVIYIVVSSQCEKACCDEIES